jgi:hypothetical protein
MVAYRVTKYNPELRSPTGIFTGGEWTSVSDVGKMGIWRPTLGEYMRVEDGYVEAVRGFQVLSGESSLFVRDFEAGRGLGHLPEALVEESRAHLACMSEGAELAGEDLAWAVRLVLRETAWCRLESARLFVHFGYDYYMYIGGPTTLGVPQLPAGIFAEAFESPYGLAPR